MARFDERYVDFGSFLRGRLVIVMARLPPLHRRLLREYKEIQTLDTKSFTVSIEADNILKWSAALFGPEGSTWDGGVFRLSIVFPDNYPYAAPDVRFLAPIPFHPNVYANGKICIDILQHNWSQAYGISSVLTSVQALLVDPNPNSPANNESASLFTDNRTEYNRRVRRCVEQTWSTT
jgi:ubiquitin-conjugating enzyme E2 A